MRSLSLRALKSDQDGSLHLRGAGRLRAQVTSFKVGLGAAESRGTVSNPSVSLKALASQGAIRMAQHCLDRRAGDATVMDLSQDHLKSLAVITYSLKANAMMIVLYYSAGPTRKTIEQLDSLGLHRRFSHLHRRERMISGRRILRLASLRSPAKRLDGEGAISPPEGERVKDVGL